MYYRYYRLKDEYILRGWKGLPYAVVDTRTGESIFLTNQRMNALELCDGNIDLSMPFITNEIKDSIIELENAGIIEQCREGHGLNENQKYIKYPCRYIHDVHWAITGKCNYRCKHCFISAPNANLTELPHDKIMQIINQLSDFGVMQVSLTGGEPFIRDVFFNIIDALKDRNITVSHINTNGSFVTEDLLNEFASRNIKPMFVMSYDGYGCHDWLRGVKGAEEKVNESFRLCIEKGFPVKAIMAIHKGNCHTLRESVNHLAALGVPSITVIYAVEIGEWGKRNGQEAMGIEDMYNMYIEYIPHYYEDGMPMNISLTSFFRANRKYPDRYEILNYKEEYDPLETILCNAIRHWAYISPEGRVLPCTALDSLEIRKDYPTLFGKNFADCVSAPTFMNLVKMTASELREANEQCRTCESRKHCTGGCRVAMLCLGYKDLTAANLLECALHRGGWLKRIVETVQKARPTAECPVKDLSLLQ